MHFTKEVLLHEYVSWYKKYGYGRNSDDWRFGQYLYNTYSGYGLENYTIDPFFEEDAHKVFMSYLDLME